MNINFNSGYNNFQYGQQGANKIKEDKNAKVSNQNVQTANVTGETVQDMETVSWSETFIHEGHTYTRVISVSIQDDSPGINPNNNLSMADILKVNNMNYRNI